MRLESEVICSSYKSLCFLGHGATPLCLFHLVPIPSVQYLGGLGGQVAHVWYAWCLPSLVVCCSL